jgi:hypothetical protein
MTTRPAPNEMRRRTRGRPMLWLLIGLFIFAMFALVLLAVDWIDPQGSRLLGAPHF